MRSFLFLSRGTFSFSFHCIHFTEFTFRPRSRDRVETSQGSGLSRCRASIIDPSKQDRAHWCYCVFTSQLTQRFRTAYRFSFSYSGILTNTTAAMLAIGAASSVSSTRSFVSVRGSRRALARVRAVYDYDRVEQDRLENTDAFQELVAMSRKQSVNKPHKVYVPIGDCINCTPFIQMSSSVLPLAFRPRSIFTSVSSRSDRTTATDPLIVHIR